MMRRIAPMIATLTLLALPGCNAGSPAPVAAAPAAAPETQTHLASVDVPGGTACAADITRWNTLISSDADTGNANQSVFVQVRAEIDNAAAACRAGRDAEARAMVRASRARHGYPAG